MKTLTWLTLGLSMTVAACSSASTPPPQLASNAACSQLDDSAQATQAFYAPGQVYAARKIQKKQFIARAIQPRRTMGAELYMHAPAGLTQEYLERTLVCHAAHGRAAHPNDPMHPTSGAVADVSVRPSGSGGFAIKVLGDTPRTGKEIWQRSRAFTAPSTSVTVEQVGATDGPTHTL